MDRKEKKSFESKKKQIAYKMIIQKIWVKKIFDWNFICQLFILLFFWYHDTYYFSFIQAIVDTVGIKSADLKEKILF